MLSVLALGLLMPVTATAQDLDFSGMSGDDMLRDADERISRMEETLNNVVALRDRTEQEEDDLTKVRCINRKIAAIQGFLRLSTDSRDGLGTHVANSDQEGMVHQYTLIVIASQRVSNLEGEATQCAGEILTFAGDTEQQTSIDPSIPDETDLTAGGDAAAELGRVTPDEPLPEATPFQ
jgi:hypothetical protein